MPRQNDGIKTVLILNPISSPAYLYEKFKQAGFYTLACFTSTEIDYLTRPSIEKKLFDQIVFIEHPLHLGIQQIQNILQANNAVREEMFQTLSSYQRHWIKIPQQPEPKFPETLLDTVAFIILVSDSELQIESDLQTLIDLEKVGGYFS